MKTKGDDSKVVVFCVATQKKGDGSKAIVAFFVVLQKKR
jgi:hypothetical protein